MRIEKLTNYHFAKDLMSRNMGETTMVYNPSNGDMYEMNETAAILIEYLVKEFSGIEILNNICDEYDVERDTLIEDLDPLIDRLIEIGLLIPEDSHECAEFNS